MRYDYGVVGGGIVGAATALKILAAEPGASLVLLEKEQRPGMHQTGHNSGVIHSGIYYEPGSLKATLCRAGAQATKAFCDEHGIRYRNIGKLLVATDDAERARMDALFERSRANNVDVTRVGRESSAIAPRERSAGSQTNRGQASARSSAASTCRVVHGNTGISESACLTSSSSSVQPRITPCAPASQRSSITETTVLRDASSTFPCTSSP